MTRVDSMITGKLTDTLGRHAAFDEEKNPALVRAVGRAVEAGSVARVLGQYSLLPATIVEFLKTGETRLAAWKDVREELKRNIGEEQGARTDGKTHYEILATATRRELGLDLTLAKPTAATEDFLNDIRLGLHERPPAHAAGMVFALEASAIPELTVVARLVNRYAELNGRVESPIILSESEWRSGELTGRRTGELFTLNGFFAAHLFDFEVGHKNRLAEALRDYLGLPRDSARFAEGFANVLDAMDRWWEALADEIRVQESLPLLDAARRQLTASHSAKIFLPQLAISR